MLYWDEVVEKLVYHRISMALFLWKERSKFLDDEVNILKHFARLYNDYIRPTMTFSIKLYKTYVAEFKQENVGADTGGTCGQH